MCGHCGSLSLGGCGSCVMLCTLADKQLCCELQYAGQVSVVCGPVHLVPCKRARQELGPCWAAHSRGGAVANGLWLVLSLRTSESSRVGGESLCDAGKCLEMRACADTACAPESRCSWLCVDAMPAHTGLLVCMGVVAGCCASCILTSAAGCFPCFILILVGVKSAGLACSIRPLCRYLPQGRQAC